MDVDLGRLRWLRGSQEISDEQCKFWGLERGQLNHPCVIIDATYSANVEKRYTICMVRLISIQMRTSTLTRPQLESFRNKSAIRIDWFVQKGWDIPVLPNSHYPTECEDHVIYEGNDKPRFDEWVRTEKSFTVPERFLRKFREERTREDPKLTLPSVRIVRRLVKLNDLQGTGRGTVAPSLSKVTNAEIEHVVPSEPFIIAANGDNSLTMEAENDKDLLQPVNDQSRKLGQQQIAEGSFADAMPFILVGLLIGCPIGFYLSCWWLS